MVDYLCEIINKDKTSTTMQSILIVEDDITFSTMLRTWLGKKGFQAETAGSVTAAKRLLEKTAFDLILSDRMRWATYSLPVPLAPSISTDIGVGATSDTYLYSCCEASLLPSMYLGASSSSGCVVVC